MSEYKKLLRNIFETISNRDVSSERFKIPDAQIIYEGNTTIVKNFDKISDMINRDPNLLLKFLLGALGTAGELKGGRAVFKGKIPDAQIQQKIKNYVETYVICPECGRPDTHLLKKDRLLLIRCDACGAFRSTKSRRKRQIQKESAELKEGNVYTVTIKDIGRKGDGVAYYNNFRIYVPGAVKGSEIRVKIEKISGSIAFGKIE